MILPTLKYADSRADVRAMAEFPVEVWAALGVVGGVGVLAVLHTLAAAVRSERAVHDTKVKAAMLRRNYARQLAEAAEVEVTEDVIILPDPPAKRAA